MPTEGIYKAQAPRGGSDGPFQDFREATMGKLSHPMRFEYEIHLQR